MPSTRLERTVIRLSGETLTPWLSGLITNTILAPITFAALLTPQGKIIADFFIYPDGDDLILETAHKFTGDLVHRLELYKLRNKIDIEVTTLSVYAFWGDQEMPEGSHIDPRSPKLGRRRVAVHMETDSTPDDYDLHRLKLGIADSSWDFESAALYPANANMDRLNGIDFKKGCFIGQEVVSRMHRKTDIKKRMCGFQYKGELTEIVMYSGDRLAGDILHTRGGYGMALLRSNRAQDSNKPLTAGSATITLLRPEDNLSENSA